MKFFLDTTDINEIKKFLDFGLVDGVTTNPSLIANSGRDFFELITEICEVVNGPVSAEVVALNFKDMMAEAKKLIKISKHVAIKVPLTFDGLKACRALSAEGIMVNVTLCFSATQALMAAKAGAAFVSPFVGRLDDTGQDGMDLIRDICNIFAMYPYINTQVLVASVRNPVHVLQTAKMGADVATMPPKVMEQMIKHPLTDAGIEKFLTDWQTTGQKI